MKRPSAEDAALAVAIGQWLRILRLRRGLSQERIALEAGLDVTTYARIERAVSGDRWANPRLHTAGRILRALEISPGELYQFLIGAGPETGGHPECDPREASADHAAGIFPGPGVRSRRHRLGR
ncbi:helix-turn-helix transcriptional regulator [Microbacterium sp. NPDC089320]|uniref:helix-turn-helix transcriptional regulator n=1 Tax=Microbacterium sp. NPDC089320 TaxID=3155182 RepID=UPI00344677B4